MKKEKVRIEDKDKELAGSGEMPKESEHGGGSKQNYGRTEW